MSLPGEPGPSMENETPKILLVTGRELPEDLGKYALKMAQRLDFEVILLFVDHQPQLRDQQDRRAAVKKLEGKIEGIAARFSAQAWEMGVRVVTVVHVDEESVAVAEVCAEEPAIAMILSDSHPEGETGNDEQRYRLRVIRAEEGGESRESLAIGPSPDQGAQG